MEQRPIRLAVDIILHPAGRRDALVLVERRNPPHGFAFPGGFVEYGETVEAAACREAWEETGLQPRLLSQFYVYSDPRRDPRGHTVSVVFIAEAEGEPQGGSDARHAAFYPMDRLPGPLAFDHARILADYRRFLGDGVRPIPSCPA